MVNNKIKVDGNYYLKIEQIEAGCRGCVAQTDDNLCFKLQVCIGHIFIKYPLKNILKDL